MAYSNSRLIKFKIYDAIPGSLLSGQGGPAQYGEFLTYGQLNIHNVVGFGQVTPGQPAVYYTKATGTLFGPDSKKFRWNSTPDDSSCPYLAICVTNFGNPTLPANRNQPKPTAWVKVTYTPKGPGDWSPTNTDTWLVEGDFADIDNPNIVQRMTLYYENNNKPLVHYGQYSLPFRAIVKALAPMP